MATERQGLKLRETEWKLLRAQSHSSTSNSCIAGKLAVCGKQMRSAKSFHRPTLCIQHEFGLNMSLSLIMVPWKRRYALLQFPNLVYASRKLAGYENLLVDLAYVSAFSRDLKTIAPLLT